MLIRHCQVDLIVSPISFIDNNGMEVRVLQVEVHDGVLATQVGEMSESKLGFPDQLLKRIANGKCLPGSFSECKSSDDSSISLRL